MIKPENDFNMLLRKPIPRSGATKSSASLCSWGFVSQSCLYLFQSYLHSLVSGVESRTSPVALGAWAAKDSTRVVMLGIPSLFSSAQCV